MVFSLFVLSGWLFYRVYQLHKRTYRIQDIPRSKLSSAAQGLIEVEGFAWPREAKPQLHSTRGEPAVYRQVEVQRFVFNRWLIFQRLRKWQTIYKKVEAPAFYVLDPTGVAEVQAENCEHEIENTRTHYWQFTWGQRRKEALKLVPENIDRELRQARFRPYRIVEKCILVGSPLLVSGDFRTDRSATEKTNTVESLALTQFSHQVINKRTKSFNDLTVDLDLNGDGQVSSREARNGYSELAQLAMQKQTGEIESFTNFGRFQNSANHFLFLADQHEDELLHRMKKSRNLNLAGAFLAFSLSFYAAKPSSAKRELVTKRHQECYAGQVASCRDLIYYSRRYKLNATYLAGYRNQACRLGSTEHCDSRRPADQPQVK